MVEWLNGFILLITQAVQPFKYSTTQPFLTMKKVLEKYGKKALVLYICWCTIKGLAFLALGGYLLK